jgi:hypothetical protein
MVMFLCKIPQNCAPVGLEKAMENIILLINYVKKINQKITVNYK